VTETTMGLATAAAGGALLALAYFAGLWWTVRRLPASSRPGRLATGSFLVRAALAGAALVALAGEDPARLLVAVGAFAAVRQWVVSEARAGLHPTRTVEG
jgi:F1F0 ATPase subunit 2